MGIFDRFRDGDQPRGRTFEAKPAAPSEDEQALARYRYMLKTAPPETIEQAHAEAFAKLTPQQRKMVLEQLQAEMPEAERSYATENPQSLARLATRAEVRQPGAMERMFSRVPGGGPGMGGMIAGSLIGSLAGTVLGTMIAQNFMSNQGANAAGAGAGQGTETGSDGAQAQDAGTDTGNLAGLDDSGGGFDSSSFDI